MMTKTMPHGIAKSSICQISVHTAHSITVYNITSFLLFCCLMFFSEILEVVIGMIKDDVVTVEHKQETVCHVLNYIIVTDLG